MNNVMDSKLLENELIEAEEGYMFYCNNCNNKFTFVYSFTPIPKLTRYYVCSSCNSILPVKDLKKIRIHNWFYHFCLYKFFNW